MAGAQKGCGHVGGESPARTDTSKRDRPHCLIVAEVGNVHEGSLGNCHAFIDAVAEAGVDAVKFQCHVASQESSPQEGWPKRFSFHPQDDTRQGYWRRMEFDRREWSMLCHRAAACNLKFIVTPFCIEAIERCRGFPNYWKIGSGQVSNKRLLMEVQREPEDVILSTGMSTTEEILDANRLCFPKFILQCTTEYPCPPEQIGLSELRPLINGLSDHGGTIWPSIIAAYLGAEMIEVHVCWDKRQFGADVSSSVTIDELKQLVEGVRFAERMGPIDKDAVTAGLSDARVYVEGKNV